MAPTLAPDRTRETIDACSDCAEACHICANEGIRMTDPMMVTDVLLCLSCADACLACIPSLAREANYQQLCQACAELCDACAAECDRFDDAVMRQCAQACRRTAQACKQMATA